MSDDARAQGADSSTRPSARPGSKDARAWIETLFEAPPDILFEDIVSSDPLSFPGYREQLARAAETCGASESVIVADGSIDGVRVVAIVFEFGFLGGSMGVATGERICRAFERAAEHGVPLIALVATGGARMQEGMLSLAQMPATIAAREVLTAAHQPFIAYLRHPTTGGVYASFASTADVIWAEPRATIGFAGPRVAETFTGAPLPGESHTAESAAAAGLIDGVLDEAAFGRTLRSLLRALTSFDGRDPAERPADAPAAAGDPWDTVELARHPSRPAPSRYTSPSVTLRRGSRNGAVEASIAKLSGKPVVTISVGRGAGTGAPDPADYAVAHHAIALAGRLGLPIVTFIDTRGADPSADSEGAGIARAITTTFAAMLETPVPTVACVTGEGGSGGALALAACDRILIQENAIFSVIGPEGAAAILRRTSPQQTAADLKLTAHDLSALGLADLVVIEPATGAHTDPDGARAHLEAAIAWALDDIAAEGAPTERRRSRWRAAGGPS